MLELRIVKLSIYYYIKDKLTDAGWGTEGYYNDQVVTFMDAFPNDDELNRIVKDPTGMIDSEIVLPIVALEQGVQISTPFEIGSKPSAKRLFTISVLGREKAETDDIAQSLYEWIDEVLVPVKNYNQGFPPDIDPTTIGYANVSNARLLPVRIVGSPDVADRNRLEITFDVVTTFTQDSKDVFPV